MRSKLLFIISCIILNLFPVSGFAESNRQERRHINKGNSLYNEHKYVEAQDEYEKALNSNSASAEAKYNLGLSQVRQIKNPADTSVQNKVLLENVRKNFSEVASLAKTKAGLAAKANFNLGNLEFNLKDYQKAIDYYKQALRIDPSDEKARKNLRIAQKNLNNQNQNQDNKQNNQEDKQENKKDKEDQQSNQNQNQDQNQQKDKDKQQEQNKLSNQAASQILQAIDNKENATRARVNKANNGEKSAAARSNLKKW